MAAAVASSSSSSATSSPSSVTNGLLKAKEPGGNFNVSMTTDKIVDLMNPIIGFYKMPTAAYYGGGYPSGEMKVIVKSDTKTHPFTLPSIVQLELARSLVAPSDVHAAIDLDDEEDDHKQRNNKNGGRGGGGKGGRGGGGNERGGHGGRGGRGGGGGGGGAGRGGNHNNGNGASTPSPSSTPATTTIPEPTTSTPTPSVTASASAPTPATATATSAPSKVAASPAPSSSSTPAPTRTGAPKSESKSGGNAKKGNNNGNNGGKNPNGRAAALAAIESKACIMCGNTKDRGGFSQSQWKKDDSKCKACQGNEQPAAPAPTPAPAPSSSSPTTTTPAGESKELKDVVSTATAPRRELTSGEIASLMATSLSYDFFFIISDITNELQNAKRKRNDVVNLVHHSWCFPECPPGERQGMNLPSGIFPVDGCNGPRFDANGGRGSLAYNRLTSQRISIHSDKRDRYIMCCSPNNARFFIDMKQSMTVFITAAHVPPRPAKAAAPSTSSTSQPRAVVSLQWLLHRPDPAMDRVIQSSRNIVSLINGLATVMPGGVANPALASLIQMIGQSHIDAAKAADTPTPPAK